MAKKVVKIDPVKQQVVRQLQPKKRVCAYCRVSTDSREQQHSFTAQLEYYTALIENQENWLFAGIYADEARSGTSPMRRTIFTWPWEPPIFANSKMDSPPWWP
ncbi:Mobile element protein [Desulfosporosinus sp. I2]|uniref:recombinase family protein n=1 Tax=Desulfosporosinus sp. I2 TaxID=1617025 RepID=UPI00061F9780|nr:recombinase family protein [Desulfosporosinus sp. I2]KJR44407.1 Mobile element protein [Desulfosporosinus sp. I2]